MSAPSFRRLAAATGVTATLLTATVFAAPVAGAAGSPNQVALVVDYPDGHRATWCVGYTSGMTGANVLAVAGPTYGQGPYAGFVLQIGGQGTVPPTDDDYWAYWVTQNGRLTYSGTGVGSNRPAAGDVQAWHWNSSGSQERPSAASYAALCPNGYAGPATPAPTTAAAAPGGGGGAPTGGSVAGSATGGATSRPTTGSGGSSSTAPNAGSSANPTGPAATDASSGGATPATSGGASSTDPTAGSPAPRTSVRASDVASTRDTGGGTGQTIGLLVVGVAVLGLGGTAVVVRRRRAQGD